MHITPFMRRLHKYVLAAVFAGGLPAMAAELDPPVQAEVDAALAKLAGWAADAEVVAQTKAANANSDTTINNGKWAEFADDAPEVTAIVSSPLSQRLGAWLAESGLNKLFLRDRQGNLVAGPEKPLIYNIAKRPAYKGVLNGGPWHATEAKPDPTTQRNVVQISVPVKDGDQVIGVLHSSVILR